MSNYFLKKEDYAFKQAVFFGMGFSHLKQAKEEVQWRYKVLHVVLGLTECFPVVGQIVSMIELGIASFFIPTPSFKKFSAQKLEVLKNNSESSVIPLQAPFAVKAVKTGKLPPSSSCSFLERKVRFYVPSSASCDVSSFTLTPSSKKFSAQKLEVPKKNSESSVIPLQAPLAVKAVKNGKLPLSFSCTFLDRKVRSYVPSSPSCGVSSCFSDMATDFLKDDESGFIWPKNLDLLGISSDDKKTVDLHLKASIREGDFTIDGKQLHLKSGLTVALPRRIALLPSEKESKKLRFILYSKKTIFLNHEREEELVYDFSLGKWFLRKEIEGFLEKELLLHMQKNREDRGLTTEVFFEEDLYVLESFKPEHLGSFLDKSPSLSWESKILLIQDLITEMCVLHEKKIQNVSLEENKEEIEDYQAFHNAIDFEHILLHSENGQWRAGFCGWGTMAAHPLNFLFSPGFTSPEYMEFHSTISEDDFSNQKRKEIIDFHLKYGQKKDIWSLGLIFLSILAGKTKKIIKKEEDSPEDIFYSPPLDSLLFFRTDCLSQEIVDQEIEKIKEQVEREHPEEKTEEIFSLLFSMLKVIPEERELLSFS